MFSAREHVAGTLEILATLCPARACLSLSVELWMKMLVPGLLCPASRPAACMSQESCCGAARASLFSACWAWTTAILRVGPACRSQTGSHGRAGLMQCFYDMDLRRGEMLAACSCLHENVVLEWTFAEQGAFVFLVAQAWHRASSHPGGKGSV